ncbi:Nn.00g069120.m01.CDS01 [Neocucurbitaria sp. VM-36]
MTPLVPTQRLLLFLALATSAYAYSNNLWHKDFDTFPKWKIIQEEEECREAYESLNKLPRNSNATALINCILDKTDEVTKSEFGVVAVMLGLLPGVLQLVGPKFSDLAMLATRRPILALFLTIGSPCPALDYETTGMESFLVEDASPFWPAWLRRTRRPWLSVVISLVEYFVVMVAAGNVVFQFYRLTFYAVVLISTQMGQYGGTLEAFAPLLWVFIGIPIHALGVLQLHWCRVSSSADNAASTHLRNRTIFSLLQRELTPCAFATDIRSDEIKLQNGPIYQILNWMIKLCIWADVIYGIIVLSTILFVPMWSAIWMIGLIFTGTLICRLVLAFEMHGLREVPKVKEKASKESMEADYEMARLMPENGKAPPQEHALPLSHR